MGIYEELASGYESLKKEAVEDYNGVDDFLSADRMKLSSLDDFFNFSRIGNDTLVHKAEKDLWKISEDNNGQIVVERLFDPNSKTALKI